MSDFSVVNISGVDINVKDAFLRNKKLKDIANVVSDFGADNTGTKDSTSAIQNALNSGKPYVYFPEGTYKTSDTLYLNSNTYLFGHGATIESNNEESKTTFLNESDGTKGGYTAGENITIDGFTILSHNGQTVIGICHAQNINIINCHIECKKDYLRGHLIEINSSQYVTIDNNVFKCVEVKNEFVQLDVSTNYEVFPWYGPYDGTKLQYVTINNNKFIQDTMIRPKELDLMNTGIGNHNGDNDNQIRHVHITNNYFSRVRQGLKFKCLISSIIDGNTIDFCQSGINHTSNSVIRDCVISNNYIFGNYSSFTGKPENVERACGIRTGSELLADSRNLIVGNIIKDMIGHGIWYVGGKYSTIENNLIVNCGCNGLYAGYATENVKYVGNTCYNNGRLDKNSYYDLLAVQQTRSDIANSGNNVIANNYANIIALNKLSDGAITSYVYDNICNTLKIIDDSTFSQWGNQTKNNTNIATVYNQSIDASLLVANKWNNIANVQIPEQGIWLVYFEIMMPAGYTGNATIQLRNGSTEVGRSSNYSDGKIQTRFSVCLPCYIENTLTVNLFLENTGVSGAVYRYRVCKLGINPNGNDF